MIFEQALLEPYQHQKGTFEPRSGTMMSWLDFGHEPAVEFYAELLMTSKGETRDFTIDPTDVYSFRFIGHRKSVTEKQFATDRLSMRIGQFAIDDLFDGLFLKYPRTAA